MANSWLRLWHDMPNDPKWRTIARVSKQSIPAVLSVYIHLLVIASNANERGRTQNVCSEDLASALDLDAEQVEAIMQAMQGRVLDGDMISGWSKRQVEREDGAAERAKRWREAKKQEKQTQANASERKQTPDKDKDTDKEEAKNNIPAKAGKKSAVAQLCAMGIPEQAAQDWLSILKAKRAPLTKSLLTTLQAEADKAGLTVAEAISICAQKGWARFEADWLKSKSNNVQQAQLDIAQQIMGGRNGNVSQIIDVEQDGSIAGTGTHVPKIAAGIR